MRTHDHLNALTADAIGNVTDWIQRAYDAGYRDGGEAMRDAILRAANAPAPRSDAASATHLTLGRHEIKEEAKASRAPRGILQETVITVLTNAGKSGLSLREIEDKVLGYAPTVSRRSIYGELRRKRGELYEMVDDRWVLLRSRACVSQEEAAGLPSKTDPPLQISDQGGQNGTALA